MSRQNNGQWNRLGQVRPETLALETFAFSSKLGLPMIPIFVCSTHTSGHCSDAHEVIVGRMDSLPFAFTMLRRMAVRCSIWFVVNGGAV